MKISKLKTDPSKEENGVWVSMGDNLRIKVARLSSEGYKSYLRKIGTPYRSAARSGNMDEKIAADLVKQAIANKILLGWENLEEDDGTPIVYSPQKALQLFQESNDFLEMVRAAADDIDNFRTELMVDAKGNS